MNKHSWLRLAWSIACVAILGHTPCRAESDLDLLKRQTREFDWAPISPDKPALSQAGPWAKALRSDGRARCQLYRPVPRLLEDH